MHLSFVNCYFLRWRGGPSRQASQRNANRDKTGGQGGARDNNTAWGASSPPQEQHVPVRGFNTAEVKNILKKGRCMNLDGKYNADQDPAIQQDLEVSSLYNFLPDQVLIYAPSLQKPKHALPTKPHRRTAQTKNPLHGAREVQCLPGSHFSRTNNNISAAHFMANGKDFFLELRKQIAALQRGGPPVGG
jgi:hypothetical protein